MITGKGFAYGTGIGEAMAPLQAPYKMASGAVQNVATTAGTTWGASQLGNAYAKMTQDQQQKWYARLMNTIAESMKKQSH